MLTNDRRFQVQTRYVERAGTRIAVVAMAVPATQHFFFFFALVALPVFLLPVFLFQTRILPISELFVDCSCLAFVSIKKLVK